MNRNSFKSCVACNTQYKAFPSSKKKFCSRQCYWKSISLRERPVRLTGAERQKRHRERNYQATHDTCSCGSEKQIKSQTCIKCYFQNRRGVHPYNYKGGMENHLKHGRERALKMKIIGAHTDEEWSALKMHFNYACLCCKKQEPFIKLSRDHIIPVSRGGSDDISNIQPLCRSCNSRKYTSSTNFIKNLTMIYG